MTKASVVSLCITYWFGYISQVMADVLENRQQRVIHAANCPNHIALYL